METKGNDYGYVIRRSTVADVDVLLSLADEARATMRASGNMNQWVNGYPSREVFERDIAHGVSFMVIDGDGLAVGAFAFQLVFVTFAPHRDAYEAISLIVLYIHIKTSISEPPRTTQVSLSPINHHSFINP